ncbi:ABC transporter substrate-binding protein [Frankia sp. CNm7]|uniref:ABC transporter substrate-binding protein n=1 Tax=Frankia nepalensis TaxID=1836974 RepID=A0A937RE62_9ACTN|nr:ABC transporter substrate-binding protein [Frankia nepalensis]MBL7502476.1 ABC transporter substrate-binding protein [Frankia nepalensis]MBL7516390.1 ABC transporter substrate-binding protein [Frankia nepalensis]MBL7517897.1 ABC transporter substrate-binding protein [Frankia nepalensis]MBL7625794.1 ABC transporter substrate-binding protein [Frankia nepalensis]
MIRKVRLIATALVCGTTLVLGACGGGGSAAPGGSAGASGAAGEPVAGGNGRILTLSEPRSLDPITIGNAYASSGVIGNALYGTLMTSDDAGKVVYKMAASFTTADSGASFELKLKPGLVFSDGTPLDAAAVKFNWERAKDPATGSVNVSEASMIASAEVVDPVTLKIGLTSPVPSFAQSIVTSTLNWIASPAALEKGQAEFDKNPVGAGPFMLKSWTRQATMELVKNPKYWDAPRPYLDSISFRPALDASQRFNTISTGGADVAIESNWVNLDKAAKADLPTEVMDLSGGIFLAMNARRAPFDDVRARQAIAAALDMNAVNQAVYSGTAEPADTLFAKDSPYYSDTPLTHPDKAKAQQLFDELAAEGKPVSFTFTSAPTTENRTLAENVQAQLSAFRNVTVQVKIIEVAELAGLRRTHDFDMATSSAFFQDPEPRLFTAFHSTSAANLGGLADPQLDQALQDARTATTDQERETAYGKLQDRLIEQVPMIFHSRAAPSAVTSKNVGGVQQYGLGSLLPEELWIKA